MAGNVLVYVDNKTASTFSDKRRNTKLIYRVSQTGQDQGQRKRGTNPPHVVALRLYNRGYARPPFWFCVER